MFDFPLHILLRFCFSENRALGDGWRHSGGMTPHGLMEQCRMGIVTVAAMISRVACSWIDISTVITHTHTHKPNWRTNEPTDGRTNQLTNEGTIAFALCMQVQPRPQKPSESSPPPPRHAPQNVAAYISFTSTGIGVRLQMRIAGLSTFGEKGIHRMRSIDSRFQAPVSLSLDIDPHISSMRYIGRYELLLESFRLVPLSEDQSNLFPGIVQQTGERAGGRDEKEGRTKKGAALCSSAVR